MNPTGFSSSNLEKLFFAQYLAFSASTARACNPCIRYDGFNQVLTLHIDSASSEYSEDTRPVKLFPYADWYAETGTQEDLSFLLDRFIQFLADLTEVTVAESFSQFIQLGLPPFLRKQAA